MNSFVNRVFALYFDVPDKGAKGAIDTSDERDAFEQVDDVEEKVDEGAKEEGEDKSEEEEESLDTESTEEFAETEEEGEEEAEEDVEPGLLAPLKKIDKDIFKKVPELRSVIFREARYTEVYPTVKEAEESRAIVQTFQDLQADILNGNIEPMLEAVEKSNKDALSDLAANFLPTLEKQNEKLYHNVLAPHFKKFLRLAAKGGDENIVASARNLNFWLFGGDSPLEQDAGLQPKQKSDKEDSLTKREKEFEERQYNSFAKDAFDITKNQALRIIKGAFANSDMSALIQNQLASEIFSRVDEQIAKDKRHLGNMNNLWNSARNEGYTTEGKNRLIRAYLSRAKVLIPKVRAQVLSEAKVSAKTTSGNGERKPTRIPSSSSSSSGGRQKITAKNIDWDKVDNERDLLDGKVPLRK